MSKPFSAKNMATLRGFGARALIYSFIGRALGQSIPAYSPAPPWNLKQTCYLLINYVNGKACRHFVPTVFLVQRINKPRYKKKAKKDRPQSEEGTGQNAFYYESAGISQGSSC
ncbi:hypothetical protein [Pseudoduganella buxea]|uniref:hypothetical protein n=1 Tax=Pseudoduganella buxea TaxID=1949069 RepID=UPI001478D978|nr:hypothetical protein [Pseudoduganella buxea]